MGKRLCRESPLTVLFITSFLGSSSRARAGLWPIATVHAIALTLDKQHEAAIVWSGFLNIERKPLWSRVDHGSKRAVADDQGRGL